MSDTSKDFTIAIDEEPKSYYSPAPSTNDLPERDQPQTRPSFWTKLSDFITDWTPFGLVASYFVFSVCIYMVCTETLISVFWFVYLATNFYISAATVLEAFMSLEPCRQARSVVQKAQEANWKFPTPDDQVPILDLLVVAYLPNEKDIIMDRAMHALTRVVYPVDRIRINILYNTPKPIEPLETELRELCLKHSQLRVIKVPNSTSKADNLNYFFSLDTGADIVAIYDCDHYPHPHGPRWAVERFCQDKKVDIVQGRCVVFNSKDCLLAAMISVEFDKIYAVSHPGRATLWDFGLFCGSNGYWRASLLKDLKMDGDMLTEDIDSALRAVSRGANTVHDLNVVSYELAPTTLQGFWKQRLRWAQGWCQASIKHLKLAYRKSPDGTPRSPKVRFGLLSLLLIRELSYYLVTQFTCLMIGFIITKFPKDPVGLARLIWFGYSVSVWLFIISVVCLIATLWITMRVRSEFVNLRMIIVFSILYPFYLVINATIGLYGHARQIVNYNSWNPTARS
ncbi:glycosyltransferase family 2 protein [Aplosporella prunicola CBS 121167]|uniref:Glycosyltransferase family 2 protein n=1 Tax=Aplosporella prunicola CBS 121167 TaxID=1176127 RepID=A0A6A6BGP8_9PEZI|nr:glycosyltransferase family 2 protein [Aplosporella prunicola CBS 121167]KAF2141711.1 glycosyltransferase family 2 protein [Aplosporella prunicola CBS 121167]